MDDINRHLSRLQLFPDYDTTPMSLEDINEMTTTKALMHAEAVLKELIKICNLNSEQIEKITNEWNDLLKTTEEGQTLLTNITDFLNKYTNLIFNIQLLTSLSVTPEQYGAVGDGITDDTEALKQAINSSHKVLLKGDYLITETLEVNDYSSIEGMTGKERIIIKTNNPVFNISKKFNVNIKNCIIYGSNNWDNNFQNTRTLQDGILISNSSHINLENIYITNMEGNGIKFIEGIGSCNIQTMLKNCYIKNNGINGIEMSNIHGIHIIGGSIEFNRMSNFNVLSNVMDCLVENINCNFSDISVGSVLNIETTLSIDYCVFRNIHIEDNGKLPISKRTVPCIYIKGNNVTLENVYVRYNKEQYDNCIIVDKGKVNIIKPIIRQVTNGITCNNNSTSIEGAYFEDINGYNVKGNYLGIPELNGNLRESQCTITGIRGGGDVSTAFLLPYNYNHIYSFRLYPLIIDSACLIPGSTLYVYLRDKNMALLDTIHVDINELNNNKVIDLTSQLRSARPFSIHLSVSSTVTDLGNLKIGASVTAF